GTRLTPVNLPNLINVVAIAAGEAHTCALLASGTARCWGLNSSGQLGSNTASSISPTPTAVAGLGRVVAIAAGGTLGSSHTCALQADGKVLCWGSNNVGQLGVGFVSTPSSAPVLVPGLSDVVAIAVGEQHSCALVAIGALFCWGSDGVTSHLVPTLVSLDNVVAIAGGNRHSCALRADGTAWCWGQNLLGQLGNGGTTSTASPSLVGSGALLNVVSIAGGFGHSCTSLADGTAHCFGDNTAGQLGDATTTSSKTPTLVQAKPLSILGGGTFLRPLRNVVNVTTGRRHSCSLSAGGAVSCWGENAFGQLGNNSTINSNVPVSVPSFALNIDPIVALHARNERVTDVTVVANCDEGQWLHVNVTLTQDAVSGRGVASGQCTGALTQYEVTVPAQGRDAFVVGTAVVTAHAVIQAPGAIADTQEWTRQVTIEDAP
ncbi:MAG TPA: hypothetical protein VGL96_10760, partial [Casimicrobiaceae bacterium]